MKPVGRKSLNHQNFHILIRPVQKLQFLDRSIDLHLLKFKNPHFLKRKGFSMKTGTGSIVAVISAGLDKKDTIGTPLTKK